MGAVETMTKKYEDSVGLVIYISVGQDLTSSTKTEIHVQRPDGTSVIWLATIAVQTESGEFVTPQDGILTYTTVEGDLPMPGEYRIQPYVEWGAAAKYYGETSILTIYPKYG